MKFKLIEDINRGHENVSSNELLDDIVYKSDNNIYEQTSKQASANRKTKEEFIKCI